MTFSKGPFYPFSILSKTPLCKASSLHNYRDGVKICLDHCFHLVFYLPPRCAVLYPTLECREQVIPPSTGLPNQPNQQSCLFSHITLFSFLTSPFNPPS